MKPLGNVLRGATSYLEARKVARSRRIAEELLAHVLHLKRIDLYLQFERPLEEKELAVYRLELTRAAQHEPWEYIVGSISFLGLKIDVAPTALIPRPETELLAERALKSLSSASGGVVWDIGTGTGCLGLALKHKLPHLEVALSDLSEEALVLARANAAKLALDVECLQGDLFTPFGGRKAHGVICNPPYVAEAVYETLDPSVRQFEPKLALVGGKSGLEFYRRLAEELPRHLEVGAKIFLEIGADQGETAPALFSAACWQKKCVECDWAGHPRFFTLEFSGFLR